MRYPARHLLRDSLGTGSNGQPVCLRDICPSTDEIAEIIDSCLRAEMFGKDYAERVCRRRALALAAGSRHRDVWVGSQVDLCAQASPLDGMRCEPQLLATSPGPRCSPNRVTRSPPITSARPGRSRSIAPPECTCLNTGSSTKTSTLRLAARQPTRPRRRRQLNLRLHPARSASGNGPRCGDEPRKDSHTADSPGGRRVWLLLVARLGRRGHRPAGVHAIIAESYERIHRTPSCASPPARPTNPR